MGYNKIILSGGQICDYLYISKQDILNEDIQQVNSEKNDWDNNTLLSAKFNGNLTAGDSNLAGNIVGYEVRRKKGASAYSEYVATIQDTTDSLNKKFLIDYANSNDGDYIYYLYPNSQSDDSDVVLSPIVSEIVHPKWNYWSLIIVDESPQKNVFYVNKIFKFELNLSIGDITNNASVTITPNFTKYPTVQYGSSNYYSGTITSLCGFISTVDDCTYVQTPNMIDEIKSLTSDTRRKFLKDIHGNIWEVKITAPITISTEYTATQPIKSAMITWAEVGDVKGISIVNNPDKSTTSWLLTETGEAIPYIEYIWDEHYVWNDAYKWTSREDGLDNRSNNLGRDIS